MTTTCFEVPKYLIKLLQNGPDNFTVVYFKQIESGLDYANAAKKLGQAIMHAAACDGDLDNSERKRKARQ